MGKYVIVILLFLMGCTNTPNEDNGLNLDDQVDQSEHVVEQSQNSPIEVELFAYDGKFEPIDELTMYIVVYDRFGDGTEVQEIDRLPDTDHEGRTVFTVPYEGRYSIQTHNEDDIPIESEIITVMDGDRNSFNVYLEYYPYRE